MTTITLPTPGAKERVYGPERAPVIGWHARVMYPWTLEDVRGHLSDGVTVWGLTRRSCRRRIQAVIEGFYQREGIR